MTDRFIDRIADLAGRTSRTLQQIAEALSEAGLDSQARTLRSIAAQHAQIALDCFAQTQPIEVGRYRLPERIGKDIEELRELAADLLERGRPGHTQITEAADLLESALSQQPKNEQ